MKRNRDAEKMLYAVFCGMILLAACSTSPVRIMPFVGPTAYPPTDPATVVILKTSPQRPFENIGHVVLEPVNALSIPERERMLREAAARMGADAVVILADMTMEAGADTSQMSRGQIVSAIAVKYKE